MGLHQYIFWSILLTSCGYALWCGQREERVVALVCLGATISSIFAIPPVPHLYKNVEVGLLTIDLAVLACFVVIALQSPRFWPLWVAGFQLTTSMAHVMKTIDNHLLPVAYGAAIALWSYPILIILAIGTWRGRRRVRADRRLSTAS